MKRWGLLCALLWVTPSFASPWSFADPVTIDRGSGTGYFHHLDGASRQHIAAASGTVAVVWEDDRDGTPQVYLSFALPEAGGFTSAQRISSGDEAYEPALVALADGGWLAAWEQDGAIHARFLALDTLGDVVRLSEAKARQVSLAASAQGDPVAVWVRDRDGGQLLEVADLAGNGILPPVRRIVPMSAPGPHPYQSYPAVAFTESGRLVLGWEDRRAGHTRLFSSVRLPGREFEAARQLNEHQSPEGEGGEKEPGLGSGVMRVTLAAGDGEDVHAAWLDKRAPSAGYSVWGARSTDGGSTFGINAKIQDDLGDAVQQWHASIAAYPGGFVVAWDDARERWMADSETGDVFLSWGDGGHWSADLALPGGGGDGYQGKAALAVDPSGGLHVVWIERDTHDAPTRLRYVHGSLPAN